jgi:hypothetical protein
VVFPVSGTRVSASSNTYCEKTEGLRSFKEFILSAAEGFRMTSQCHSEQREESFPCTLSK